MSDHFTVWYSPRFNRLFIIGNREYGKHDLAETYAFIYIGVF